MAAVISDGSAQHLDHAWENIAGLKLRLGRSVNFYHHRYRGTPWLIIADRRNESHFRCSSDAERFLRLLDGEHSVEQAFRETRDSRSAGLQKQDILLLIGNLKSAGLLREDSSTADNAGAPAQKASPWPNPFAIKIPLFDPDSLLRVILPFCRPLFSPLALLLWFGLVLLALVTAWLHWPGLVEHSAARFSDPKNLLWYWLLYPLIKALHELGHACATRVWGGAVREMGIMLLVFFPVPYVDSSAAHRFASRNRRLLVCAAGIIVETALAALALMVWVYSDHGLLRDLAFDVVVIGGVSTLLFNANPLLRFDGYYIFSELIEIPNLGTRSKQYLGYLLKRYLLDIPGQRSPVSASGEAGWLFCYAICSGIYRVFISLFIAFWIAGKFFVVGVLLALWAVVAQLAIPFARGLLRLVPVAAEAGRLGRFGAVAGIFLLALLSGLLLPVGHSTYAEGVVSLPENGLIRAGADGVLRELLIADGEAVDEGAIILRLENPSLQAKRDMLVARLEETRARQQQVFLSDRSQADILKSQVSSLAADIEDVQEQLDSLLVTSSSAGVISLPRAGDLPGRYLHRGEVIGYVVSPDQGSALVALPQPDLDAVKRKTEAIEMKLSSRPGETYPVTFSRELPQATDRLPSRILGSGAGGELAVDSRDESGVQLLSNIFLVELTLPPGTVAGYPGQRVQVRFVHASESLAKRLLRKLRQARLQAPFV